MKLPSEILLYKMSFGVKSRASFVCREFKNSFMNYNFSHRASSTVCEKKINYVRATFFGVGLGALFGGGYSFYFLKNDNYKTSITEPQISDTSHTLKSLPNIPVSRQVIVPGDSTGLKLILFQYPTCPFCCKVRAFLNYYGISYNIVEVNPVLRQQIKWSKYKKVPILLASVGDNEYVQFNDSSMIISGLKSFLRDPNLDIKSLHEYYPTITDKDDNKKSEIMNKYFVMNSQSVENELEDEKNERKWRMWADNVLVHTLSPNVYKTTEEALQAFNWFSEVGEWDKLFSTWERLIVIYVGAYAMYYIGKKLKKKHNLKAEVRESLYDECKVWMQEINKKGTKYYGGSEPNLADLAVFGVLSSIEGCLAFQDIIKNTNIEKWYYSMKELIQNHNGAVTRI